MTLEEMTLEDALDMVLRQAEAYHINDKRGFPTYIKALEMVEDAVLKYVKIEKWISEKDELNGKASIVIEDDSVRAES
mgnify:CR=1 FL=1